jgi:arylsulfatase A-like enzyme
MVVAWLIDATIRGMLGSRTLVVLVFVAFASQSLAQTAVQKRPPNIVLLYADDAGYADFGFQQDCAEDMAKLTPHIDSIAAAGVIMTNAYMSGCVCSPSRAGMMTGRYQTRFGHEFNIPPGYMDGGLPLSETFLPKRMQPLGYTTSLVGKWHLGYPADYHPNKRGFDWFYGCLQGSRSYYPMKRTSKHRVIQENGVATEEGGYTTDRLGDAGVRFINDNKDKPFFLFLSFTAPHGPLQAKAEDLAKLAHITPVKRRKYAGLVKALDDNVGKVLQALEAAGLAENTLLVFTNDNGGQTLTGANNGKLRGRKGSLFEGGIRVPMCMRWPGHIKAGTKIEDPVISLDFFPTFAAVGGVDAAPEWELDGINLLPRLTGAVSKLVDRPMFWRQGKERAVRIGQHKLHIADLPGGSAREVFDLSQDIGEAQPLADADAEVVAALDKALADFDGEMVAAKWGGTKRRSGNKKGKGK